MVYFVVGRCILTWHLFVDALENWYTIVGKVIPELQYQKVVSYDDIPIVRAAYRPGQTAVASIPRLALSGLLDPDRLSAVCASNAIASGLRNGN